MSIASHSPRKIFREHALQRHLVSPQQLDEAIDVTRPLDWLAAGAVALVLAAAGAWGVMGRVPTRLAGEGLLLGGKVVDAVSAVDGRLGAVTVKVGDHVTEGQVIASVDQTDALQRRRSALDLLRDREREQAELITGNEHENRLKTANIATQKGRLEETIDRTQRHIVAVNLAISHLEELVAKGYTTDRELDIRRVELNSELERIADARAQIERLTAQKTDMDARHRRERLAAETSTNDARRAAELLRVRLDLDGRLLAPLTGRVIEVKVSPGAVLAAGSPVAAIEPDGQELHAQIYVTAAQAKTITRGMAVRLTPATVRREEFGTLSGRVDGIATFPATPQGMAASLHNQTLVDRFGRSGAAYAVDVALEPDAATVSGYRWSSANGPPLSLSAGTLVGADVTVREQAPLSMILPVLRRLTGTDG